MNSLKGKKVIESPSEAEFFQYFSERYNLVDENNSLNRQFTDKEIERCISKLKNAKACGFDEIINEYIKIKMKMPLLM